MVTHVLSNLSEEYQNIVEIIEDELENDGNSLTIYMIHGNLLVRYDKMNKQSTTKTSIEDEKSLYKKSQQKGTCTTCGRCGHKRKPGWHR